MAAEREAFRGPSSTSIVRSRIYIIFGVFLNHKWKEKVLQGAFKSAGVFFFRLYGGAKGHQTRLFSQYRVLCLAYL